MAHSGLGTGTFTLPVIPAICMHCDTEFVDMPSGFIYDDPAAGWRQDIEDRRLWPVAGVCKPCADRITAATPRHGSVANEEYLLECERFEG